MSAQWLFCHFGTVWHCFNKVSTDGYQVKEQGRILPARCPILKLPVWPPRPFLFYPGNEFYSCCGPFPMTEIRGQPARCKAAAHGEVPSKFLWVCRNDCYTKMNQIDCAGTPHFSRSFELKCLKLMNSIYFSWIHPFRCALRGDSKINAIYKLINVQMQNW